MVHASLLHARFLAFDVVKDAVKAVYAFFCQARIMPVMVSIGPCDDSLPSCLTAAASCSAQSSCKRS